MTDLFQQNNTMQYFQDRGNEERQNQINVINNFVSPEFLENEQKKGKISAFETLKNAKKWGYALPYIGTGAETAENLKILNLQNKVREGVQLSSEEMDTYREFVLDIASQSARGQTIPSMAWDGFLQSVPYMAEFGIGLATSEEGIGLASLGQTGGKLAVKKALKDLGVNAIKDTTKQTVKKQIAMNTAKTLAKDSTIGVAKFNMKYLPQQGVKRFSEVELDELIARFDQGVEVSFEMPRLPALFENEDEYNEFIERHGKAVVPKADISTYSGDCFLGIDAGSTTTKIVLISDEGKLLYSFYSSNEGNPIETAKRALAEIHEKLPETARIARSCSTGYGEGLLKTAFNLDEGEVETIAHCTAASFFDKDVDCVLDIGGQDMKCIKLRDGAVDTIMLNEACSSGCGSFIENFANSLGYTAAEFSKEALFAKTPVDLGTRCTVFMNSNVKQAQKEGAGLPDISSGLAYSVIKNALYKVIKLADSKDLGTHIVVQGGTFHNQAVLRALEKVAGVNAVCPDISGVMGAFGAALIAKNRYKGQPCTMTDLKELLSLTYTSTTTRCKGCSNNCMLTINRFPDGRRHITGNRCEKGAGEQSRSKAPNMVEYKLKRIFDYPNPENAPRGTIGIPRVLNVYENFPFWATFFHKLGFNVEISPLSDRKIYELGMETIPSESECYPAKLAHGHVQWLVNRGIKTIFHPCIYYERQETPDAQNHYNCPMVVSYAENLKNNVEAVNEGQVKYLRPFMAFTNEIILADRLVKLCQKEWSIGEDETRDAVHAAWIEQIKAKEDIRKEGQKVLEEMEKNKGYGIVLAGRPYHIDPEINHGIPEMIASYGLSVLTEDSLPINFNPERPMRVNDQWVYHSRLYTAAEFICKRDDLELIQLNSFGCGLDAVTTDQVLEILENSNKLYTVLKIDEVNNLGAARIRLRSLLAAMKQRHERNVKPEPKPLNYRRTEYTKAMHDEKYTILVPQFSPIHLDLAEPVFKNTVLMSRFCITIIDRLLTQV